MRIRSGPVPRGFTLIEMTLVGFLLVLLSLLMSRAWAAFGRPAISAVARARLIQEANLAAESLAHDVGQLARVDPPGPDSRYQNVQASGSTLYLAIDDGTGPVRTISYSMDVDNPGKLFRIDGGTRRVVASLVADFRTIQAAMPVGPGATEVDGVRIELTLRHRVYDRDPDGTYRNDLTRLYTLFVPDSR
jgi:type II secretory pathway pseudopilin PulG